MNSEEEEEQSFPDLQLARQKFYISLFEYELEDGKAARQLFETIKERDMTPWYVIVCRDLNWILDIELLKAMKNRNDERIRELDENIQYAKNNLCVVDVKDVLIRKANYYASIGDKENAIATLSRAFTLTVIVDSKLDNVFTCLRIGLFFMDHSILRKYLEIAEDLIELGADYDRRNKYKVYKGIYGLITRDFNTSTSMFLSVVSTFSSQDLLDYNTFIRYTIYVSVLTLTRKALKEKIIQEPEILEALHTMPDLKDYVFSLYNSDYAEFFKGLAEAEEYFRRDYFLNPHYRYYVKEMKIIAYSQLLASYQSITLDFMAKQFNVSKEFIEYELTKFIGCGRITAKIDKGKEIINVRLPKTYKNGELFNCVIKDGDELLNRLQNVSRVVDSYP